MCPSKHHVIHIGAFDKQYIRHEIVTISLSIGKNNEFGVVLIRTSIGFYLSKFSRRPYMFLFNSSTPTAKFPELSILSFMQSARFPPLGF